MKVLHSLCQQIWKTQQWPQDWKTSVFIPIPKKGNAKECSNYFLKTFNINLFILIGGQLIYNIVLVLPYINMNPPQVYTCSPSWTPLPPPSSNHPSGLSLCTSPKHPVSCIKPRLAIHFLYDIIHVSMPFSQIIPPSPSPTESKRLFYTSVSLLLSCIQGYR